MKAKELAHWRYQLQRLDGLELDNTSRGKMIDTLDAIDGLVGEGFIDRDLWIGSLDTVLWLREEARYKVILGEVER